MPDDLVRLHRTAVRTRDAWHALGDRRFGPDGEVHPHFWPYLEAAVRLILRIGRDGPLAARLPDGGLLVVWADDDSDDGFGSTVYPPACTCRPSSEQCRCPASTGSGTGTPGPAPTLPGPPPGTPTDASSRN